MKKDQIFTTKDGSHSIFSEKFRASYHSKFGALTETLHVFIQSGLLFKSISQREISILEIGFGSGLNAFATWIEAIKNNLRVDYTAVEPYPITLMQAQSLNYPLLFEQQNGIQQFLQLHSIPWGNPVHLDDQFNIEKILEKIENLNYTDKFDIIYFDAFAPEVQPELWSENIFSKMYDALLPGGILVTYCAKGSVKRTLKMVGFLIESLPGPPGKREMTRAIKAFTAV